MATSPERCAVAIIACLALLFSFSTRCAMAQTAPSSDQSWIRAKALRPGDTIALVAPAGPIDLTKVKTFVAQWESAGFRIQLPEGIDRRTGYLAGTDDQRVDELNAAIRDPKVRAIFPCRGGYGVTRILDRVDYEALRRDPKILTGFSDITGLHMAIGRKIRLITFHSPMPMYDLYRTEPEFAFAAESFRRAIFADQYPEGTTGYTIPSPAAGPRPQAIVPGKARGRIWGGNLTLVQATLGTPYAIEPEGAILILEDLDEAGYRVDRMLSQLRLAGVLDKLAGVVIGDFHGTKPEDNDEIHAVLREYFQKLKVPVLAGFPIGHVPLNATLPHGAMAELDATNGVLTILENPVEP
jgi:muramoyltetrapeptide carboxypeptidase